MFRIIKNFFSTLGLPKVEVLEFSDGLLSLRSAKALPLSPVTVKAGVSGGTVRATVSVQSYDEKNGVYRASADTGELKKLLVNRRRHPRLNRVMRVTSPAIPGFVSTTEDISIEGARIVSKGPLEVGSQLDLQLELDDANIPTLELRAEVRWSGKKADSWHAGLQFVDLQRGERKMIEAFIESRLNDSLDKQRL